MGFGIQHKRSAARQRVGTWLAVFAMVSQVLFGAAHAAAMAASAFGPLVISQTPNASFGLLQICTANGLISIVPDEQRGGQSPSQNSVEDRCPVCASASTSSFLDAPADAVAAPSFSHVVISPPQQTFVLASDFGRVHPIRAPPQL